MEINGLLALLGSPGRYAWIILSLMYVNFFVVVFNDTFPGIYGATPAHHCRLPDGARLNESVPVDAEGRYSSCEVYVNLSSGSGQTAPCPDGWQFGLEVGESTVPTEWDLVCDKKYLNSLSTSLYYVGMVVGSLVFGVLSDRMGRKPMLLMCLFTPLLAGGLLYFVESFVVFVALRFTIGLLKQGLQINSFVLAMEQFSSDRHVGVAAAVLETPCSVGGVLLSLIAWALKDWRMIQVVIVSPCLLAVTYCWLIPESLRWQIATGRHSEAKKTLRFAAKINNINLDQRVDKNELAKMLSECDAFASTKIAKYHLLDLLRYRKIRLWTAVLAFIWVTNSFTAYLIMLGLYKLPGNRFVSLGISTAVEFPAVLLVAIFAHRIRRRLVLLTSCLVAGTCCVLSAFTPTTSGGMDIGWLILVFICVAKFSCAIIWTVVALVTCELYPTVFRSMGFGFCVFAAKFGSILAPQVLLLGDTVADWLPLLIAGITMLLAGLLCILLPETKGTNLPNSIEEAQQRTGGNVWKRRKAQPADEQGLNPGIALTSPQIDQ